MMRTLASLAFVLFSGCAGSVEQSSIGYGKMYPVDAQQADTIIATAMAQQFAKPPNNLGGSVIGYSSRIKFVLDTHDFVTTALPEQTRGQQGYSFHVTHNGSMPLSGARNAEELDEKIHSIAARYATPIQIRP